MFLIPGKLYWRQVLCCLGSSTENLSPKRSRLPRYKGPTLHPQCAVQWKRHAHTAGIPAESHTDGYRLGASVLQGAAEIVQPGEGSGASLSMHTTIWPGEAGGRDNTSTEERARIFSVISSTRMKGNRHKLKYGKLHLNTVFISLFVFRLCGCSDMPSCRERLWKVHPWRLSKLDLPWS